MTESEAIKELKIHIEYLKYNWKPHPDYRVLEALNIGIDSLEKQIPKKSYRNFEKFSGVWCYFCGKYLGKGDFVDKPCYCPDCGQKIDWSDTD